MRSGERGRECGKEAAARAALKGGEGELEAAARLWRALKVVAQLWRAGSWWHKVSSMQTLFHQHSWHSHFFVSFCWYLCL